MDAELLRRRGDLKLPWKAVAPVGPMNETRCQKRFKLLTSEGERPAPVVGGAAEAGEVDRDGLAWLQRKGRLTPRRRSAAEAFRAAFRDAGDLSVKSCLDVTVGGGGVVAIQRDLARKATANRELFALRWVALHGQTDLLTVVDGVCGVGHTLRALAGDGSDDKVKARARVLEAVLMVALDLMASYLEGKAKKTG